LTSGGKSSENNTARQSMQKLKQCVRILEIGEREIDAALNSAWDNLEDACLYQAALGIKADYVISRNQHDFFLSTIKTIDTEEFFIHLKETAGMTYSEIDQSAPTDHTEHSSYA